MVKLAQPITNLPVGAKIKDIGSQYNGKDIIWEILDFDHPGYPANSVTLITERIITLKCFDAAESGTEGTGTTDRDKYGSNRYLNSNIREWLNSETHPVSYTTQPPTNAACWDNYNEYDQEAGFLTNLTADFKAKILDTTLTVVKNTVTDGGGSETVTDKVFLLSNTEVGLADENGIAEGSLFSKFSSDTARQAYPTAEAITNSEYTSDSLTVIYPWYWWLRTPNAGSSVYVRYVNSSGALGNNFAFHGRWGVRPALNLSSDILVSDTTDADGAYTIEWNQQPIVTINDATYPDVKFTVSDADGSVTQVDVYLNGALKQTYDSGLGAEIVYTIDYADLNEGDNTLEIVATDNLGGEGAKTLTINKAGITVPAVGTKVVIKGKQYEITNIVNNGVTLELTLDRPLEENVLVNESIEVLNSYVIPSVDLGSGFAELDHVKTTYSGDQAEEKYELASEGRTATFRVTASKEAGATMEISEPKAIFQYKED